MEAANASLQSFLLIPPPVCLFPFLCSDRSCVLHSTCLLPLFCSHSGRFGLPLFYVAAEVTSLRRECVSSCLSDPPSRAYARETDCIPLLLRSNARVCSGGKCSSLACVVFRCTLFGACSLSATVTCRRRLFFKLMRIIRVVGM